MKMMKSKWQLHRAGLLNFWYYDEEEFYFADGKLLLRGSNGSGKSVTMQSLLPLLLDGRKSPDRLDPFGSKARRIEDYLLGEKEIVERDERTGYLYLEYKRRGINQYLTTGIGLQAKRHSSLDFWGFAIQDNRRIGKDILLYKREYNEAGKEQKIPLTRRELETRLGSGGKVVRTQKDYMELVNKQIFGFESLDAYEDLIKLLIQLRSPKLSKEFRPTAIYEILTESLPALSDEELRPLSDTIENMDQTKQQLDQLVRDQQAIQRLCKQYDLYNQFVLAEKAHGFLNAKREWDKLLLKKDELEQAFAGYQTQLQSLTEDIASLNVEQQVLQEEEDQLREHDVFRAEAEKQKIEEKLRDTEAKIEQKKKSLTEKQSSEWRLRENIKRESGKIKQAEADIEDYLDELEIEGEEAAFGNHALAVEEFKRYYQSNYGFELWKKDADDHRSRLENILKVLREQSMAKERYSEADRDLGEARKELDLRRSDGRKWEQIFDEEKQRYLEAFHQWNQRNKVLVLSEEEAQIVVQRVMQLHEGYRSDDIFQPLNQALRRYSEGHQNKLAEINHRIGLQKREIADKQRELQEWKGKKDPEPLRHEETVIARKKLAAAKVPHIPFFAAVEFCEDVPPEQRERIESAITQMGLLDALIVPEGYSSLLPDSDRIIRPRPQMLAHTLADFLIPVPVEGVNVSSADIDNVLRSIVIEHEGEGNTVVREDGTYRIGLLQGQAPRENQSVYIGKESRRQYRMREIARLQQELEALENGLQELDAIREKWLAEQRQLEEEYGAFPATADIDEAYRQLDEVRKQIQLHEKEVERKNERVKETFIRLQNIRNELRELTEGLSLETAESVYEEAKQSMQAYLRHLQGLELTYKDFVNSREMLKHYEESLEEVIHDVDELKGELNVYGGEVQKLKLVREKLEQQMQDLGAEEIRQRISQIVERRKQIPAIKEKLIAEREQTRSKMEATKEAIAKNAWECEIAQDFYERWRQVFIDDDRLQLVDQVDPICWSNEEEVLKRAKTVGQTYGSLLSQGNLDRERVSGRLNQSFFQEQGILVEYRLTQETALEVSDLPETMESESLRFYAEQLRQKSRRTLLLMEYSGKRVSPYYVSEQIEKDIELQRSLLNEKDRELYEEIIMNSVGRIIRTRINRAERWVEKINQLMGERDTSSGITFSLRWKPRVAEIEEEMDTKELVDLLRSDARLLKEEDIQRVTRHFRSKVSHAKELMEGSKSGETLHQMMKEILDYRQWFSFTLYYRREGEQRRELTNHVFYTFSGGEKAMAMYIPLFSAVYSRYLEARDDAPFIISLDEAFAGVDENNIRDMFDLVEKLGFNYIMNSQALWGDYDTVSSLSICELVRPKNASFVTVVRYHWDGKVRRMLTGNASEEDLVEEEIACTDVG